MILGSNESLWNSKTFDVHYIFVSAKMHEILADLNHFWTGSCSILKNKQKFKKIPVHNVTR